MRWVLPLVLLLGCQTVFMPREAIRYEAHPAYARWYKAMQQCAGPTFCRSRWGPQEFWTVEGPSFPCPALKGQCGGWWTTPHTITVASYSVDDSLLVSHEMLHDILQAPHGVWADPIFARCGV